MKRYNKIVITFKVSVIEGERRNLNMFLNEARVEEIKDILYLCYEERQMTAFPSSCGLVSEVLAYLFGISELSDEYEIFYQRGHYRNDEYEEDCDDEEYLDFKRGDNLDRFPCINCTCYFMNQHSWIELVSKKDGKITILDFTSIQFGDYSGFVLETERDRESLYEFMKRHSTFLIEEKNPLFKNYIPSQDRFNRNYLISKVEQEMKADEYDFLTLVGMLNEMGYLTE